jgi:hypothetical protein
MNKLPSYQDIHSHLREDVIARIEEPLVGPRANTQTPKPPVRCGSLRNLAGLLATDQPPPTDEDVARWLDEHKMEKYGR